ncbi:hypothetical protein ES703_66608 [subsurface metagenome]
MKREVWYLVVVRDRHGQIVSRERRKARSFLKAWNQMASVQMSQNSRTITDIGGTARSVARNGFSFRMAVGAGITNHGIVIGTGDTAVTINDYALAALIAHGAGGGQMNYQACSVALSQVSAPNCDYIVSRSVVNNSGVLITVKESGIYIRVGPVPYYACGLRDVFGTPQDVPNGGSITVNYTLRVTA